MWNSARIMQIRNKFNAKKYAKMPCFACAVHSIEKWIFVFSIWIDGCHSHILTKLHWYKQFCCCCSSWIMILKRKRHEVCLKQIQSFLRQQQNTLKPFPGRHMREKICFFLFDNNDNNHNNSPGKRKLAWFCHQEWQGTKIVDCIGRWNQAHTKSSRNRQKTD